MCPGTPGSCPTCWPEWARSPPCSSSWRPTAAGCRSRPSISLPSTRPASPAPSRAVPRSAVGDRSRAMARAPAGLRRSSLGEVRAVAVSAVTGAGVPELIAALSELTGQLPRADPKAPVRIWVDRAFSITGSGTVVTGTLPAGSVRRGDELLLTPALRPVKVRALQSLGENATELTGVARAALNLRGIDRADVARGVALGQPGPGRLARQLDVRI